MKKNIFFILVMIFSIAFVSPLMTYDLESIKIEHDAWYFDEKIYVYFSPLNEDGNIVSVTNVEIEIEDNISIIEGDLFKTLNGTYKEWFIVPLQDIKDFDMNVTAYQNNYQVTETFSIKISEKDFKTKVKYETKEFLEDFVKYFIEKWLWFLVAFLVIIAIILGTISIKHYTNKK